MKVFGNLYNPTSQEPYPPRKFQEMPNQKIRSQAVQQPYIYKENLGGYIQAGMMAGQQYNNLYPQDSQEQFADWQEAYDEAQTPAIADYNQGYQQPSYQGKYDISGAEYQRYHANQDPMQSQGKLNSNLQQYGGNFDYYTKPYQHRHIVRNDISFYQNKIDPSTGQNYLPLQKSYMRGFQNQQFSGFGASGIEGMPGISGLGTYDQIMGLRGVDNMNQSNFYQTSNFNKQQVGANDFNYYQGNNTGLKNEYTQDFYRKLQLSA